MANFNEGDRVIAVENLGTGASKGTKGVVTHVAFQALLTFLWVDFMIVRGGVGRGRRA